MRRNVRWLILFLVAPLWTLGTGCPSVPAITIQTPVHGTFSTASSITVSGTVSGVAIAASKVVVNGTQATLNANGTWSIDMPLSASAVLNPMYAELKRTADNVT
ncbi:MAG TPA: hypothetical protein VLV15_02630, partial [Dongiaceae bacterium]|nr:hypothetical protein [Dongiaceae bacterium]